MSKSAGIFSCKLGEEARFSVQISTKMSIAGRRGKRGNQECYKRSAFYSMNSKCKTRIKTGG